MKPNFLKQCAAILCAAFTLTTASLFAETFTEGKQVPPTTQKLGVGDFVWEPERSPGGPVLIVVSVPEQVAYVYRNGIRIARTSVSTGRPGHPTPTGVFDILEKEKDHVSTIYKGAEMPWMERLTWTGIAMHAGDLPGYPDSHGCVRLPLEFSKLLYTVTTKGGTVIIANEHSAPRETVHPGLLFSPTTPPAADAALASGRNLDTGEIGHRTGDHPASEPTRLFTFIGTVSKSDADDQSVGTKACTSLAPQMAGMNRPFEMDSCRWQPAANDPACDMAQKSGIDQHPIVECARSSFPAPRSSSPTNR
jgi:hypothetical protein